MASISSKIKSYIFTPFIPSKTAENIVSLVVGYIAASRFPSVLHTKNLPLHSNAETLFFVGTAVSLFLNSTDNMQMPVSPKLPKKLHSTMKQIQIGICQIAVLHAVTYVVFQILKISIPKKEIAILMGSIYLTHRFFKANLYLGSWLRCTLEQKLEEIDQKQKSAPAKKKKRTVSHKYKNQSPSLRAYFSTFFERVNITDCIRPLTISLFTGACASQLPFFIEKYHFPAELDSRGAFVAATLVSLGLTLVNSEAFSAFIFPQRPLLERVKQYAEALWLDKWIMTLPKAAGAWSFMNLIVSCESYSTETQTEEIAFYEYSNISTQEIVLLTLAICIIQRMAESLYDLVESMRQETQPKKWIQPIAVSLAVGLSLVGQRMITHSIALHNLFVISLCTSLALSIIPTNQMKSLLNEDAPRLTRYIREKGFEELFMAIPKITLIGGVAYTALHLLEPQASVQEKALLLGAIAFYHLAFSAAYQKGVDLKAKKQSLLRARFPSQEGDLD